MVSFSALTYHDGQLYWIELRPSEGGRQVLVSRSAEGEIRDRTPPPINVRTRVHEYGGGSFAVRGDRVIFSDFVDQRLYGLTGDVLAPITPEPDPPASVRFADGTLTDPGHMVCVRETHHESGEAVNELVMVDIDSGSAQVLASGRDFYAGPRVSEDGDRLAWLEWDHPSMPWDGTELMMAGLGPDGLAHPRRVAGGREESIVQPEWAPDGTLVFNTDRTGWWNLHRWDGSDVSAVHSAEADFGDPAWVFGRTSFGFLSGGRILAGYWKDAVHRLVVIDAGGRVEEVDDELSLHERLITDGETRAWFIGRGASTPSAIYELDVDTRERTIVRSNSMPVAAGYVYEPMAITYPTSDGELAHAIYYPPRNPDYVGLGDERPPLLVQIHGGPTSHVYPVLAPDYLYWTTRGIGVVDVNYRGSTSYGRDYRNRLRGNWGVTDVDDATSAARYLADEGYVDGDRLIITGASAGGYTTLAALAFGDVFSAGASYFGVADLQLLDEHTHKFESRYLDGLVGPDPEVMRERSPLYSVDRINVPVILFQGLEDRVVPPEQAAAIARALDDGGIPHAHITYPGEDHGFRHAENIIHSLESELVFYGLVLGFTPEGDLPDVPMVGEYG